MKKKNKRMKSKVGRRRGVRLMSIAIQIVCLLALVVTIFAWYLSLMEFLVNLYIHRDNQLRGKEDEESDFVNTREIIKEDIVNFFNWIAKVFKIRRK